MAQRMQWSLPGHSGHGRTFCWLDPVANDPTRTCRHGRSTSVVRGIVLQKSFWGVERKFLGPLMRFTRGDVRTISLHPKSTTDLPGGFEKLRSRREVQGSAFARFLGLFDFRLLQHNWGQSGPGPVVIHATSA